MEYLLLL